MNVLTTDIISLIANSNYVVIINEFSGRSIRVFYMDQNRKYHRIDGPAAIWGDNEWMWCFHGKKHRDQGPATNALFYYSWYNMDNRVARRKK